MTGPEGNSEFCFPRISMFPSTSSRETLRFSGNKIHCSPRDQSLSVYYYTFTVKSIDIVHHCCKLGGIPIFQCPRENKIGLNNREFEKLQVNLPLKQSEGTFGSS